MEPKSAQVEQNGTKRRLWEGKMEQEGAQSTTEMHQKSRPSGKVVKMIPKREHQTQSFGTILEAFSIQNSNNKSMQTSMPKNHGK